MVRKSGQQGAAKGSKEGSSTKKRGRGGGRPTTPTTAQHWGQGDVSFIPQWQFPGCVQSGPGGGGPCLTHPGQLPPADLQSALQRMGLLPVLPRLPAASHAAQSHLLQLNGFLEESYTLQQRGHELWLAEQLELQRGADLAIISPPNLRPPPTLGATITPIQMAPSSLVAGDAEPVRSPTGVLLSPQTTTLLVAMGTHVAGVLSPALPGSSAAQLLSPRACGLLLQELPHRRLLSPGAHTAIPFLVDDEQPQPTGSRAPTAAATMRGVVDLDDDADLLPTRALVYPDFHHSLHHEGHQQAAGSHAGVTLRPGAGSGPSLHHHHHHTVGALLPANGKGRPGPPTTPSRSVVHHNAQLLVGGLGSPLSPSLLVTGAAGCGMDLIGAYADAAGPLDSEIHAELRLDGAAMKRAKR